MGVPGPCPVLTPCAGLGAEGRVWKDALLTVALVRLVGKQRVQNLEIGASPSPMIRLPSYTVLNFHAKARRGRPSPSDPRF